MIDTPQDLYDGVILDHSKEPRNFGPLTNPSHYADGRNPICGDEISVFLQTKGDAFSAFAFSGQGCAISKASASLMTEDLRNRPPEQARERANEILQALGQDMEGDPFERYGEVGGPDRSPPLPRTPQVRDTCLAYLSRRPRGRKLCFHRRIPIT